MDLFNKKIKLDKLVYKAYKEREANRIVNLIKTFEKKEGIELTNLNFNEDMVLKFTEFLIYNRTNAKTGGYMRNGTVVYYMKQICHVINKAKRNGYKTNDIRIQNCRLKNEETTSVYLTLEELERIDKLNLTGEVAQIRDLFLIGCYTGLRFSDYSRLSKDNFKANSLEILTKKTKTKVIIPLHVKIKEIIERNKNYDFLKLKKAQQFFNNRLKAICKQANVNKATTIEYTKGGKIVKEVLPKYELVTSHTARRTAATNMYLAGIPTFKIMLITGHKTEASFFKYIRINKQENAKELTQHPFFMGE